METKDLWCLFGKLFFDDIQIFLVIMLLGIWGTEWLDEVTIGQEIFLDEFLKIGDVGTSIPSIGDMTTVHNLSEHILQIVVWNNLELLEIVGQDVSALIQITLVELISNRETLGTELSSTENQGMVEAQGEQKSFELIWFRARIDSLLGEVGEGSIQVILQ